MSYSEAMKLYMRQQRIGKANPNYKTGKSVNTDGYVTVPAPELGPGGKRKLSHRVKAEARKGTAVHHINHRRSDNRRGNLKVTRNHPGVKGKR